MREVEMGRDVGGGEGVGGTFVSVETRAHPLTAVAQTVVGALHASVVVEAR